MQRILTIRAAIRFQQIFRRHEISLRLGKLAKLEKSHAARQQQLLARHRIGRKRRDLRDDPQRVIRFAVFQGELGGEQAARHEIGILHRRLLDHLRAAFAGDQLVKSGLSLRTGGCKRQRRRNLDRAPRKVHRLFGIAA